MKMTKARCLKCRKEVEIKDAKEFVMKNNLKALKGKCPVCSTTVFRIIGKNKK
jgi:endogenous inhibitor of DNA gyrase (YacG/DUF329 family)